MNFFNLRSSLKRRLVCGLAVILVAACSADKNPLPLKDPDSPEFVNRGQAFVQGLAACGTCHGVTSDPGAVLAGGRKSVDRYGEVAAANITPSASGIGAWSAEQIMTALRESINPKGEQLSLAVHSGYEWLSDEDALAIISYLKSLTPIDHEVKRRSIDFIDRNTTGFFESRKAVKGYVPKIDKQNKHAYGRYLVDSVARCQRCHNSEESLIANEHYLEGGKTITNEVGSKIAPSINGSVIFGPGAWSEEDIVTYLKTGVTPEGRQVDSHFCPVRFYARADEADLRAIASYLKSLTK